MAFGIRAIQGSFRDSGIIQSDSQVFSLETLRNKKARNHELLGLSVDELKQIAGKPYSGKQSTEWNFADELTSLADYTIKLVADDLNEINIQSIVNQVDSNNLKSDLEFMGKR